MKRRIRSISPHPSAMTMALVYVFLGVLMWPLFFLVEPAPGEEPFPKVLLLVLPLLYGVLGYVAIAIAALLYNLAARWVGGIEVTFDEQRADVVVRRVRRAPTPPEETE